MDLSTDTLNPASSQIKRHEKNGKRTIPILLCRTGALDFKLLFSTYVIYFIVENLLLFEEKIKRGCCLCIKF